MRRACGAASAVALGPAAPPQSPASTCRGVEAVGDATLTGGHSLEGCVLEEGGGVPVRGPGLGGEDVGGGREGVRALDPAAQQRRRPTSTVTPLGLGDTSIGDPYRSLHRLRVAAASASSFLWAVPSRTSPPSVVSTSSTPWRSHGNRPARPSSPGQERLGFGCPGDSLTAAPAIIGFYGLHGCCKRNGAKG